MNNYSFNNYRDAVVAAMNGIQEGFSYLYDTTFRDKYYVALKYVKNEETASDVVQDAYMRAFQNLSMLQDPDKFPGWIGMIVANTAKNYLKKKNPVLFSEMDQDNGEGDTLEYQDTLVEERADFNPEEYYSKKEISELVNELLDSLPEEQKICMIMFYLEGQSMEEIATALECSIGTVGSRLNYGRKKIKAKGEELERRGYKLYGFSPVVLLGVLLRDELRSFIFGTTSAAAVAGTAVGVAAESAAAGGTMAATGTVAGTEVGTAVGGTAGGTGVVAGTEVGAAISGATAGAGAGSAVGNITVGEAINSVVGDLSVGGTVGGASGGSVAGVAGGMTGGAIDSTVGGLTVDTAGTAVGGTAGGVAGGVTGTASGSVAGTMAGSTSASTTGGAGTGKPVAGAAGKTAGSGAAKTGFLSTVAGKVAVAVAGTAVVGGLAAGTVALIKNNDKKDEPKNVTEYVIEPSGGKQDSTDEMGASTETDTEANVTEGDGGTSEGDTEPSSEVVTLTDDEALTKYLEEVLIPEYGIYNPGQAVYTGHWQIIHYITYSYNEWSGQLIENDLARDVTEIDGVIDYTVDLSGIYYASVNDYDNDTKPELMVIRGSGEIDKSGNYANYVEVEMYDALEGEAILAGSESLYVGEEQIEYGGNSKDEMKKLYITQKDNHFYLSVINYPTDVDIDGYCDVALYDLSDLSRVACLHGEWYAGEGTDYAEIIYADGTVKNEHFDYDAFGEKGWRGYAEEKGYLNADSICIMNVFGGIVNDFQRKYLYKSNPDGVGREEIVNYLEKGTFEYYSSGTSGEIMTVRDDKVTVSSYEVTIGGMASDSEATAEISGFNKIDDYRYSITLSNAVDKYTEHTENDPDYPLGYNYHEIADRVNGEYILIMPGTPVINLPEDAIIGDSFSEMPMISHEDQRQNKNINNTYIQNGLTKDFMMYSVNNPTLILVFTADQ